MEGWRAYSGDPWHRVQRRYWSGSRSPVGEHGRWPCYPSSDDEGLAECYAAIVSATPLPLFVYSREWVNPSIACLLGGFLSDRQVRLWGRRWGRTLPGVMAYGLGGVFMLVAIPCSGGHVGLAHFFLCLSSFVKDCGMAASWSMENDIGHRYSRTVAGFMNTVGNLSQVIAVPVVAWLAMLTGSRGHPNWRVSLSFYAAMFFVAAVCWLFVEPRRRIIAYSASDQQGSN